MTQPTATYSHRRIVFVAFIVMTAIIAWLVRHAYHILNTDKTSTGDLNALWFITFVALAYNGIIALLERPRKVTTSQQARLDKLNVAILVPAYNEDLALLKNCLISILIQTRKPQTVCVTNDGSDKVDYTILRRNAEATYAKYGIKLVWNDTPNHGKRHAQMVGVDHTPDADIYITVDSDTILDRHAIEEGLKPFADPAVQSVAGIVLPLNMDKNLLTRVSGVWEINSQLIDRNGQSLFDSVMVNSGCLALYNAYILRKYEDAYLNEEFFGVPVKFSDDSLLTTYALQHGKTVQQATAISFSSTPEKVSHHIRRYNRWMRGSFIRTWWRFKYLDMQSYAYWLHMFKWFQTLLSVYVFWFLLFSGAYTNGDILPYLIAIPALIAYLQSLATLTVRRSDQSFSQQLIDFAISPLTVVWSMSVLRICRWYSYATCKKTGWGTRKKVEVGL